MKQIKFGKWAIKGNYLRELEPQNGQDHAFWVNRRYVEPGEIAYEISGDPITGRNFRYGDYLTLRIGAKSVLIGCTRFTGKNAQIVNEWLRG